MKYLPSTPLLVIVAFMVGWHAVMPFVALYGVELGLDVGEIGLLLSAQVGASLLASLLVIHWIEAVVPRSLALWSSAAAVMTILLMASWQTALAAFVALPILGAVQTLITIACQVSIVGNAEEHQHVRIWGSYSLFTSLALVSGPALASAAIHINGSVSAAFYLAAAFAGFAALLSVRLPKSQSAPRSPSKRVLEGLRSIPVQAFHGLYAVGIAEFCYAGWITYFPLAMSTAGFSAQTVGAVFAASGIATTVIRPVFSGVVRVISLPGALALAFGLIGLGAAMSLVLRHIIFAVGSAVLFGLGFGLIFPLTLVLATAVVPRDSVGRVLGARLVAGKFGQMIGPPLLGVFARVHLGVAMAAVATIATGAVIWVLQRAQKHPSSEG